MGQIQAYVSLAEDTMDSLRGLLPTTPLGRTTTDRKHEQAGQTQNTSITPDFLLRDRIIFTCLC